MIKEIIRVEDLEFSYGKNPVIKDVNFSLKAGDVMCVLGPNGAGKSTLLKCITDILKYKKGRVYLDGRDSKNLNLREKSKITAYVSQNISLSYGYSVEEYVLMGRAPYISSISRPSEKDFEICEKFLKKMGIFEIKDRNIKDISGGERQKAMIAKALVQEPKLIILDEPTSALDISNRIRVIRLIRELSQSGYCVIFTTHNPDHPVILNSKAGILEKNGRFIFGDSKDIINSKTLSELFGTEIILEENETLRRKICLAKI